MAAEKAASSVVRWAALLAAQMAVSKAVQMDEHSVAKSVVRMAVLSAASKAFHSVDRLVDYSADWWAACSGERTAEN